MIDIPTLETERLRLRPYRATDFDAYAAMWADPAVVHYIGVVPFSREQAWTRFLRQIGVWHYMGFGFLALEDKQTGTFAGEAGFHELRRDLDPSIEGSMEAGWGLIAPLQGKGLAEEAMRAAIEWAAKNGSGERLTCIIDPKNGASLRVAEKVGFRRYAEASYHGSAVLLHERPRLEV
jgi:RimJ/RimL family protein N-acetyltransferase